MNINKLIDHTALKPNTNKESILKLIAEAKTYDFASVCVNPCWVALAHQELKNTDVKVCTVIGLGILGVINQGLDDFLIAGVLQRSAILFTLRRSVLCMRRSSHKEKSSNKEFDEFHD